MLNIKAVREARGLSQIKLAEDSGITPAYLCELESGAKSNPGYKILTSISSALGVNVSELLEEPADDSIPRKQGQETA